METASTVAIVSISALVLLVASFAWQGSGQAFRKTWLLPRQESGRTALIVYRQDRAGGFCEDLARALAEGFRAEGLGVECWTITSDTPARPPIHEFVAIICGEFLGQPDRSTMHYLERANLGGLNVLAIIAGGKRVHKARFRLIEAADRAGARSVQSQAVPAPGRQGGQPADRNHRQDAFVKAYRMAREASGSGQRGVLPKNPEGLGELAGTQPDKRLIRL